MEASMRNRTRVLGGLVLAAVLGVGAEATAGWLVEQAVRGLGDAGRQQIMIQANRLKTVMLGPDGGPMQAFILDLNASTITQVDYAQRQYVSVPVQEYVDALAGMMQAASGQVAEAMKAMQEQLKSLPPEQRKQVEAMMRQQMPSGGAGAVGGPCVEPRREIRRTGQQATIAGYPAVRYEVLADGQLESEVWVAPGLALGRELDLRRFEQIAAALSRLAGCGPGQAGGAGADPSWKLAAEGYPVRSVYKGAGGATVEVVRAESRSIPASEFQPPAGFARKTLQEQLGR
jgi:hypothetical protein